MTPFPGSPSCAEKDACGAPSHGMHMLLPRKHMLLPQKHMLLPRKLWLFPRKHAHERQRRGLRRGPLRGLVRCVRVTSQFMEPLSGKPARCRIRLARLAPLPGAASHRARPCASEWMSSRLAQGALRPVCCRHPPEAGRGGAGGRLRRHPRRLRHPPHPGFDFRTLFCCHGSIKKNFMKFSRRAKSQLRNASLHLWSNFPPLQHRTIDESRSPMHSCV